MVDTWKRLAYKSLGSGESVAQNTTWSTDAFTKCKNLKLIVYIKNTGSIQPEFFFGKNGTLDTDNNYLTRLHSKDISGDTSDTVRHSQDSIETERSFSSPFYATFSISNESGSQKLMMGHCTTQEGTNVSSRTARYEVVGRWTESTEQINMIAIKHSQGGSLAEGSYMLVLGNDSDTVSDEKTTLADATVTTDSPSTTTTTTSGATQQGAQSGSNQTTAHVTSGSNTGLKFTSTHSGTGAAVGTFDLGSALASKWIAQVSFTTGSGYTASGNGMFAFGLSDKSTYSSSEHMNTNSSGDTVNWIWHLGASNDRTQRIRTILNGSGLDGSNGTSRAWEDSTTFYFEMSYDGSTVTAQRKTDDTYATNHSQSAITRARSGITGLQYFNWGSTDSGGSQGGFNVTLNTLKIYDNASVVSTTTSAAPPVNTRYEEVDTRKIYRWADSTDKTNICNYWKMDSSTNTDTATTANGYTNGLGKDGSNSNITVSTSDKKIGTASYEFNGASSSTSKCTYGSASDWKFLHNGDNWSATFWAKLDSLSGGGEILSTMTGNNGNETGMHFYLHPDGGGEFTMQVFNGSGAPFPINTTVNSVFTTGTWNHYAVTFNGTTVTVYKDGVLKGTITKGSAGLGSGNPTYTLHMGDAGDGAVGELDGKLDDFAIWKTVLSASFIKELYEGSATDNITGWKERGSA